MARDWESFFRRRFSLPWVLLNLAGEGLDGDAAEELAPRLREDGRLQGLCLHGNRLGDEGAARVADALLEHPRLDTLYAGRNGIGAEGTARLAALLAAPSSRLRRLDLDGNDIGDDGAESVARALATNDTLEELELSRNGIGERGARALAAALAENGTLRELGVGGNPGVGPAAAAALAKALARPGGALRDLCLDGCGADDTLPLAEIAAAAESEERLSTVRLDLRRNPRAAALPPRVRDDPYELAAHLVRLRRSAL